MSLTQRQVEILETPFDRNLIKKKGKFDFISHGLVTQRLNSVDPGWEVSVVETHTYLDQQGVIHCAGVTVALTINGVTRMEAGGPQRVEMFANEIKNAMSDALKRAAMRFGVALHMWEKLQDAEFDEDYATESEPAPKLTRKEIYDREMERQAREDYQGERDNPKGPTQAVVDKIAAAGRAMPGNVTRAGDEERVWLTWDTENPRVMKPDDLVAPAQLTAIMQLRTALGWSRDYIRDHVIPDAAGTGEVKPVRNLTQREAALVIRFMIRARDLIEPKDRPEWRPADWDKAPVQEPAAALATQQGRLVTQ